MKTSTHNTLFNTAKLRLTLTKIQIKWLSIQLSFKQSSFKELIANKKQSIK